jgi:hypothetical protein
MKWDRKLIAEGTSNDCLKIEQRILKEIDIKDDKYYNNARGAEIIFTKSVLDKMSKSAKKRWKNMTYNAKVERSKKISESKKGISRPKEVGEKLSKLFKGKSFIERYGEDKANLIGKKISEGNKGQHYHSEEHKQNLKNKMKGNVYGKSQTDKTKEIKQKKFLGDNNPGKNPTEETKKKMSISRKGRPSKNNKPIIINEIEYYSLNDASIKLGIHSMTIKNRVLSNNVKFINYKYK